MPRIKRRGDTRLGKRIRNAMKQQGLDLSQLSARSGISVSYLSRIVRGEVANPTIEFVLRIGKGLGVAVSDLVGQDSPGPGGEPPDRSAGGVTPLLARGGFDFPEPDRDSERVTLAVRDLLDDPRVPEQRRVELIRLLDSFLEWLRYRYSPVEEDE